MKGGNTNISAENQDIWGSSQGNNEFSNMNVDGFGKSITAFNDPLKSNGFNSAQRAPAGVVGSRRNSK